MTISKKVWMSILLFNLLVLLTAIILFFTLNQTSIIKDTILLSGVTIFALASLVLMSLTLKDAKVVKVFFLIYAILSLLLIVIPRGIGGYVNCGVGTTTESIFIYYFILLLLYITQAFVGNILIIKEVYFKK